MKKIRNLLITLVILIILIIASGSFYINSALKSMGDYSEKVIFEVRNNASIKTVLSDLKDSGLIRDDNLSYYYMFNVYYDYIKYYARYLVHDFSGIGTIHPPHNIFVYYIMYWIGFVRLFFYYYMYKIVRINL